MNNSYLKVDEIQVRAKHAAANVCYVRWYSHPSECHSPDGGASTVPGTQHSSQE